MPRSPSCSPWTQSSSPVPASSATTERRVPAVAYTTPLTISGVPSNRGSGRVPRLSVLKRQATSSLAKLSASICASGEYLEPLTSPAYVGHSPLAVEWTAAPVCPESRIVSHTSPITTSANTEMDRYFVRDIVHPRLARNFLLRWNNSEPCRIESQYRGHCGGGL